MGREQLEFGVVGLGQIGGNLAAQALRQGMRVSGFNLSGAPSELLEAELTAVAMAETQLVVLPALMIAVVDRTDPVLVGDMVESTVIVGNDGQAKDFTLPCDKPSSLLGMAIAA